MNDLPGTSALGVAGGIANVGMGIWDAIDKYQQEQKENKLKQEQLNQDQEQINMTRGQQQDALQNRNAMWSAARATLAKMPAGTSSVVPNLNWGSAMGQTLPTASPLGGGR